MSRFWFPTLLLLTALGFCIWVYPQLPEQIPSAFANVNGSKAVVISSLLSWMFLSYFSFLVPFLLQPVRERLARIEKGLVHVLSGLMLIFLALLGGVVAYGLGYEFSLLVLVPLGVGITFVTAGNVLQQFKDSTKGGTLLTEASRDLWNRIRFFLSRSLFIGGFLLLLCALMPQSWLLLSFFLVLGIIILAVLIGSYTVYKKSYYRGC